MSETDNHADRWRADGDDVDVSDPRLPSGTVTLLLADIEGSTRLWEAQPDEMTAAVVHLDRVLSETVASNGGVRPIEQGEGDSFVVAFPRASSAVACALDLQRAPLRPIRLRIGVHTGEVQLRDEGNYVGPTINRCARLRDLAHGGQTVLSGTTSDMVIDRLPADTWLTDLGTHALRDLPRPERVMQLCHSDLPNEFPRLRTTASAAAKRLPIPLTRFVGRAAAIAEVRGLLAENRLLTLTGAGGSGKTRLALEVAEKGGSDGEVCWVDLAPILDPDNVPVTAARALELQDQPERPTIDTLTAAIGERRMLVVLDNCEHLIDATASLVNELLSACPGLTLLVTSREPVGVGSEVTWRVPSLSLADEAVELFVDRARRARSDFRAADHDLSTIIEICRRLDGMPLAIELAASRVRALSLTEILDSLRDRFRLLSGGARSAVRRQQTLRASVEWSHALLTEPESVLFRRLAVFVGGFDRVAAEMVASSGGIASHQVLDLLSLLVDKSLVVATSEAGGSRYRLLETLRQYAMERLAESGEAEAVWVRFRDYYVSLAGALDMLAVGHDDAIFKADAEIDNLRAAFTWSCEQSELALALQLASSLQPLWLGSGRIREGVAWFDAILADDEACLGISAVLRARAVADRAVLTASFGDTGGVRLAEDALATARESDDAALLARALTACAALNGFSFDLAQPYFDEAITLARAQGDRWTLVQVLSWKAVAAGIAGDPTIVRRAAREGRDVAEAIGDRYHSHACGWALALADQMQGQLVHAAEVLSPVIADADATHDQLWKFNCLNGLTHVLLHCGENDRADASIREALDIAPDLGGFYPALAYAVLALLRLSEGDIGAAAEAADSAAPLLRLHPETGDIHLHILTEVALARRDVASAARLADEAVSATTGTHHYLALVARAHVAVARGEFEQADSDARAALARAVDTGAPLIVPDALEVLGVVAIDAANYPEAARLFGAADAIRQRTGQIRYRPHQNDYELSLATLRNMLGHEQFQTAWDEGFSASADEAIAYIQRGRGRRKRPARGWSSLTPTEHDVIRLVSDGLANKDVATRLFISPRTVQTHLTHIYTKLGLTSRVQLVQEAARHISPAE